MCGVLSCASPRPHHPTGGCFCSCSSQCESSDCFASRMRSESGGSTFVPTSDLEEQPISRTYQYRKVMKPMLERKRRARINRCLDELKELMVGALAAEGENVSKLEKADILELTVRHLHRLRRTQRLALTPEAAYADRFRAGFTHCAAEVSRYLGAVTSVGGGGGGGVEAHVGARLLTHLGHCLQSIEKPPPAARSPSQAAPGAEAALAAGDAPTVHNYAYNTPPTSPQPLSAHTLSSQPLLSPVQAVKECPSDKLTSAASAEGNGSVWRPW
ncbi:enhancer of split mbeta protein-like [Hetaerina americana]|uniref:enhancer of split mbeta protein-like n=1 Tax=Hetaerina americana TaxID=62018 RepID=UPI003A7F3DC4